MSIEYGKGGWLSSLVKLAETHGNDGGPPAELGGIAIGPAGGPGALIHATGNNPPMLLEQAQVFFALGHRNGDIQGRDAVTASLSTLKRRRLDHYVSSFTVRPAGLQIALKDCARFRIFNTRRTTVREAWDELRQVLPSGITDAIVKLQRNSSTQNLACIDMWVRVELGLALRRVLHKNTRQRSRSFISAMRELGHQMPYFRTTVVSSWRMEAWIPYWERPRHENHPEDINATPPQLQTRSEAMGSRFITVNVNGFWKKVTQVESLLRCEKVMVCAMQETLVSAENPFLRVPGYKTYAVERQEGFRGQAMLVDDRLASFEVTHGDLNLTVAQKLCLLHVKVTRIPLIGKCVHCIAVYLPSGGNYRGSRASVLRAFSAICVKILRDDPDALIVAMGDFNMDEVALGRRLASSGSPMLRKDHKGSGYTRFPVGNSPRCLDHFVVSPAAELLMKRTVVKRRHAISDHRPVVTRFRAMQEEVQWTARRSWKIDYTMVKEKRMIIVNDNRWLPIANMDIETAEELDEAAEEYSNVHNDVLKDCGAKVEVTRNRDVHMPAQLKRLLKKKEVADKRYAKQLRETGTVSDDAMIRMKHADKKFRLERRKWNKSLQLKQYKDVADAFIRNDHRTINRILEKSMKGELGSNVQCPVKDRAGVLQTSTAGILGVVEDHYRTLAQDDPEGLSGNDEHWANLDLGEDLPTLDTINGPMQTREVWASIRRMNRNTAPGICGSDSNVLKVLVQEESMAALMAENPNFVRPERVQVNLRLEQLANEPLTPMGKALFKIISTIWSLERTPRMWDEVWITNLFKSGDPELMVNYRGISLISVALKVLLNIMTDRLSTAAEAAGLIVAEQAGFRKREECIAQFIAMAEVVRRRELAGEKATFGIFVDFKKAYDKVHHGALFRVLDHVGVRGKFLNIVRYMYGHSAMRVRINGELSEPFDMLRGTRQGCPLSPLLFLLFINTALRDASVSGVSVPGTRAPMGQGVRYCPGGMYADDIKGLEATVKDTQVFVRRMWEWGQRWGMELGFNKCGVMCWTRDPAIRAEHDAAVYATPEAEVPKVTEYKYLGITVNESLPWSRDSGEVGVDSLEMTYVKSQARKGATAANRLQPFLHAEHCPLYTKAAAIVSRVLEPMAYGFEWTGFKQLHSDKIQTVLTNAAKQAVGVASGDRLFDGFTLCYELGIPTAEMVMTARRARLWAKLRGDKGKTWMQTLFNECNLPRRGGGSWVSSNRSWLTRLMHSVGEVHEAVTAMNRYAMEDVVPNVANWAALVNEVDMSRPSPLRPAIARGRCYESDQRANDYSSVHVQELREFHSMRTPQGFAVDLTKYWRNGRYRYGAIRFNAGAERLGQTAALVRSGGRDKAYQKVLMKDAQDCVLERQMHLRDHPTRGSAAWRWYDRFSFGATRGYLRAAVARPDIAVGVKWLTIIRVNAFPRVSSRWVTLRDRGEEPDFGRDECPLCNKAVLTGWEWAHLAMECSHSRIRTARAKHLSHVVEALESTIPEDWKTSFDLSNETGLINQSNAVVGIYLAGGVVDLHFDHAWHTGFGQLDLIPNGLKTFGFAYLAAFLQEAVPLYLLKLGFDVHGRVGLDTLAPEAEVLEYLGELGGGDVDELR